MKRSLVLACLVGAFAVTSFAQSLPVAPATVPAQAGAKRVAERDAEWRRAHPGAAVAAEPKAARKTKAKPAHAAKAGKRGKHVKTSSHGKQGKHAKTSKQVKHAKPVKQKAKKTKKSV